MKIWLRALSVVVFAASLPTGATAEQVVTGTWTLETNVGEGGYMLASRNATGQYLICFTSGTVRTVVVAAGLDESRLARGSCTVFVPTEDRGIVVDFPEAGSAPDERTVALGTFSVILPASE